MRRKWKRLTAALLAFAVVVSTIGYDGVWVHADATSEDTIEADGDIADLGDVLEQVVSLEDDSISVVSEETLSEEDALVASEDEETVSEDATLVEEDDAEETLLIDEEVVLADTDDTGDDDIVLPSSYSVTLTTSAAGVKVTGSFYEGSIGTAYLYRREGNSGAYTLIKSWTLSTTYGNDLMLASLVKTWNYTDTDVEVGKTYEYYYALYNGTISEDAVGYSVTVTEPVLSIPTLTVTNKKSGVYLSWTKSTNATGYVVMRYEVNNYSDTGTAFVVSGSNTLSYTDTTAKNGVSYYYYVMGYKDDSSNRGVASSYITTVRLTRPTIKSLVSSTAKKLTVKWKKNSKATGYQIQYSTSKTFSKNVKTKTVTKASKISKVISGLKSGKNYYVRVRSYKTVNGVKYYSAWSAKKKIKVL